MTTAEAAQALDLDRSRVLRFIHDGRLKAARHGRDWWIDPEEVERFKSQPRRAGWKSGTPRTNSST